MQWVVAIGLRRVWAGARGAGAGLGARPQRRQPEGHRAWPSGQQDWRGEVGVWWVPGRGVLARTSLEGHWEGLVDVSQLSDTLLLTLGA